MISLLIDGAFVARAKRARVSSSTYYYKTGAN